MNISGCVVLVTGANRGLGRAFLDELLAAGAIKVYAGTRGSHLGPTPRVVPIQLDVTDPGSVNAAATTCSDVTLVINNAGIARTASILGADDVRSEMEANFFGTLAMSRAFSPVLRANGGGALVNVLSVLSWVSVPGTALYSASKAAAWSLTNGLRHELRPNGTLVVAVHVGYMDTAMASHVSGPKVEPADVARQVLSAIETGQEEVLADALSRQVKATLSAEPAVYLAAR